MVHIYILDGVQNVFKKSVIRKKNPFLQIDSRRKFEILFTKALLFFIHAISSYIITMNQIYHLMMDKAFHRNNFTVTNFVWRKKYPFITNKKN